MFMLEQIKKISAIEQRLVEYIQPLNDRLKPHNMYIWWDGDYKEWFINQYGLDTGGISFWMTDAKFMQLMDMNDNELIEYCKKWGCS